MSPKAINTELQHFTTGALPAKADISWILLESAYVKNLFLLRIIYSRTKIMASRFSFYSIWNESII